MMFNVILKTQVAMTKIKREFESIWGIRKRTEWHATAGNMGLAQAGHCLVGKFLKNSKLWWLVASVCKPRLRQALARYKQWHYSDLLYRQLPLKRQFFIHLHKYKEHNKHYLLNVNL